VYLFGRSKSRLVFEGNGFFVNVPAATNNYQPSVTRKAIELSYDTDSQGVNYWEFDIVEQGNTYAGASFGDAPVFTPPSPPTGLVNPRLSPQVSEFTRVKAFGTVWLSEDDTPALQLMDSYNVLSVVQDEEFGPLGWFTITFANELDRLPNIVATALLEGDGIMYEIFFCAVQHRSTSGFTMALYFPNSGGFDNGPFHFVVF
jgi:hypothetical protein